MNYTVEEVSQIKRKLTVDVPLDEVQKNRQKILKKVQRTAKFKGFRPGKAPLSMVEREYGPKIDMDCVEELLNHYFPIIVEESKLEPLGSPKFDFKDFDLGKDFTFTVEFEIQPEFTLDSAQYLGLDIKEPDFKVDDQVLEDTLKQLRTTKATYTDVKRRRIARVDDTVIVDYQTFDGDEPLEDMHVDTDLDLSPGALLPEIEKALIGAKVGEKVEAFVDFDDNARTEQFKGKRVRFAMELKGLKEKQLPELTDEFVKANWPGVETVEALKERLTKSLKERQEEERRDIIRQQIITKVAKLGEFEVPEVLVRKEQENMVRRFHEYMKQDGIGAIPGLDNDTLLHEVEDEARFKVRAGMALACIAKQENIEITEAEIDEEIVKQAGDNPLEQVREFFVKNNLIPRLADSLVENKILARIQEAANITKVAPEEIEAIMDALKEDKSKKEDNKE